MAYSEKARALRQCRGTTKDGAPCKQWAVWGDELQRCARHGGRIDEPHKPGKTHNPACRCFAYAWPHRPGSGLCQWPDMPEYRLMMRAGTHALGYREKWRFWRQPSAIACWRIYGIKHGRH